MVRSVAKMSDINEGTRSRVLAFQASWHVAIPGRYFLLSAAQKKVTKETSHCHQ